MQWHHFTRDDGAAEALVVVLFVHGGCTEAKRLASTWARAVPRSAFAGIELEAGAGAVAHSVLRDILMIKAAALDLGIWQIVLAGTGVAGRQVLDLVTTGVAPGISAIVIDLPPGPLPVIAARTAASIRFVQHVRPDDPDGAGFDALVHALRRSSIDTRVVVLPAGADPASQAFGTFLVELVANASIGRSGRGR
jgi:hypothetical protein